MKNLFERTSSNWVRYSEYEWKAAEDGTLFLTPTATAQPSIYDPLSEYCPGCHQYRAYGIAEENAAGDTKGNSAVCHEIRSAWSYDSTAHHTELYGL